MIKESTSQLLGKEDVYVVTTSDGSNTLFSKAFRSTYHSIFGAVSESKHTYIQNCLLTQLHRPRISILEFGFGTGLNAFLAFLFAQKHQIQIDYLGYESYLLEPSVVHQLDYPGYLAFPGKKDIFQLMHDTNAFSADFFHFQRIKEWNSEELPGQFDCIFFDAFDPDTQPELWGQEIFDRLFTLTSQGGCLVTYSSKGEVRRRMIRSGFTVKRIHGAPGKREMLQAFR